MSSAGKTRQAFARIISNTTSTPRTTPLLVFPSLAEPPCRQHRRATKQHTFPPANTDGPNPIALLDPAASRVCTTTRHQPVADISSEQGAHQRARAAACHHPDVPNRPVPKAKRAVTQPKPPRASSIGSRRRRGCRTAPGELPAAGERQHADQEDEPPPPRELAGVRGSSPPPPSARRA